MQNKQAPREIVPQNETLSFSAQLSSLAEKTQEAYREALQEFKKAQTTGSPHYFMGRD